MKICLSLWVGVGLMLAGPAGAVRMLPAPLVVANPAPVILVAQGCGPYAFRDAWGYCRRTAYYGPYGSYYYRPPPYASWTCPPGFWRGPWGQCRNTPYHGRMPGGWYQP